MAETLVAIGTASLVAGAIQMNTPSTNMTRFGTNHLSHTSASLLIAGVLIGVVLVLAEGEARFSKPLKGMIGAALGGTVVAAAALAVSGKTTGDSAKDSIGRSLVWIGGAFAGAGLYAMV